MQNETQTKITIRDVAKRAGVSCATVSRVLNKLDRVSEETRQRVNAAIEELSFTRSSVAASMITGKTKTVVFPLFFLYFDKKYPRDSKAEESRG
jgi:LacI family transcriptional regulator